MYMHMFAVTHADVHRCSVPAMMLAQVKRDGLPTPARRGRLAAGAASQPQPP
jgi:hypothetical protein